MKKLIFPLQLICLVGMLVSLFFMLLAKDFTLFLVFFMSFGLVGVGTISAEECLARHRE